jgi:purine-binding chemotaxis protein CheW
MSALTEAPSVSQQDAGRQADGVTDGKNNQFLTFMLGEEEYGVDILRVQEIRGWDRATPIPNSADYVCGVVNLRGAVVPIIDLRRRFKKEPVPYTSTTVVIVVKVFVEKGEKIIGLLVDAVSDVRNARNDELRPPPDVGLEQQGFVKGLATLNNDMIILLDVDRLLFMSLDETAQKN